MDQSQSLDVLAHELRSPVAALGAIADVVAARRKELTGEDAERLVRLAIEAVGDIERIVLDATPASLRRETVQPGQLVDDVVDAARLGGAAVRRVPGPVLSSLDADPVRLRQALSNLVANAVAHSPPGADVIVSADEADGRILISVTDRGEGIAPADQERIFEPGVRLADRPGRGIGLSIASTVAEAHGGALEVMSAPGEGATFRLVLPTAGGGPA